MRAVCLMSLLLLFGLAMSALAQKKFDVAAAMPKRDFKREDGASLGYRFFAPAEYKADGKDQYPLVVFLHGAGERGDDNTAQLVHGVSDFVRPESQKKHPCFVAAPQCPTDEVWVWGLIPQLEKKLKKPRAEAGDLALELVESLCKEYRIDRRRVYLTGLSMGGYGTWELLARAPDRFAAGLPVCGGGHVKHAAKIAGVPLWAFQGDKDEAVPPERSREMIAAVEKAGGKPRYTEYKDVGHDSWTQTYADDAVRNWLFAQKKQ